MCARESAWPCNGHTIDRRDERGKDRMNDRLESGFEERLDASSRSA